MKSQKGWANKVKRLTCKEVQLHIRWIPLMQRCCSVKLQKKWELIRFVKLGSCFHGLFYEWVWCRKPPTNVCKTLHWVVGCCGLLRSGCSRWCLPMWRPLLWSFTLEQEFTNLCVVELTSEPKSSAADLVDAIYADFQRIRRPRNQRPLNRVRLRGKKREWEGIWGNDYICMAWILIVGTYMSRRII